MISHKLLLIFQNKEKRLKREQNIIVPRILTICPTERTARLHVPLRKRNLLERRQLSAGGCVSQKPLVAYRGIAYTSI
jgi:hypothetical protein